MYLLVLAREQLEICVYFRLPFSETFQARHLVDQSLSVRFVYLCMW